MTTPWSQVEPRVTEALGAERGDRQRRSHFRVSEGSTARKWKAMKKNDSLHLLAYNFGAQAVVGTSLIAIAENVKSW